MNTDDLIAEGQAIAKRCFHLSIQSQGEIFGYWGGRRSDFPEVFPPEVTRFSRRRHIVTISQRLLRELGLESLGAVGLFEWEDVDGNRHLNVERDSRTEFDTFICDGEPLYAIEATSFPPFEALCLYGSERVAAWLQSLSLERYEYWKVPRDEIAGYREFYEAQLPLFLNSLDVVVGGWHLLWLEDDYYVPAEMKYLFLTLRDAEPWYSVWYAPMTQACFSREHIT